MVSLRVTEQTPVTSGTLLSVPPAPSSASAVKKPLDVSVLVSAGTKGAAKATAAAQATHALRTEMYDVLHEVANHFRLRYGPLGFKKVKFDWDPDSAEAASQKAIAAITSTTGLSRDAMITQFHGVLRDFVNGTHDYHVSISFTRTEAAKLPFRVQLGQGNRYFICGLDTTKTAAFRMKMGDEVTSFNGKPIADVITSLEKYGPSSNDTTDLRLAATMLTQRRPSRGVPAPDKPTALVGIRHKDGSTATVDVGWSTVRESVTFSDPGASALDLRQRRMITTGPDMTAHGVIDQNEIDNANAEIEANGSAKKNADRFVIGGRNTFVPDLGPIVTRTSEKDPFNAYIYRAPNGKNVGVIRIPEYGPDKPEEMAKAFAELVAQYEKATDALIIDQNNNPGGYFFYMMALLSTLSPNAMKMTGQAEAITPQEVFDAQNNLEGLKNITDDKTAVKKLGKTLVGLPVTYDVVVKMRAASQHIIDEWNKGKTVTSSFPLEGIDSVNPSTTAVYTKPILCLVNSLCFSCGDFFPAALQTNGRARIFGETTAGAGGYVLTEKFVNGLGVEALHITGSIADRGTVHPDGSVTDDPNKLEHPIESTGVVPDRPYTLTANDLQNDFADYKAAVNDEIVKMTS